MCFLVEWRCLMAFVMFVSLYSSCTWVLTRRFTFLLISNQWMYFSINHRGFIWLNSAFLFHLRDSVSNKLDKQTLSLPFVLWLFVNVKVWLFFRRWISGDVRLHAATGSHRFQCVRLQTGDSSGQPEVDHGVWTINTLFTIMRWSNSQYWAEEEEGGRGGGRSC